MSCIARMSKIWKKHFQKLKKKYSTENSMLSTLNMEIFSHLWKYLITRLTREMNYIFNVKPMIILYLLHIIVEQW